MAGALALSCVAFTGEAGVDDEVSEGRRGTDGGTRLPELEVEVEVVAESWLDEPPDAASTCARLAFCPTEPGLACVSS